MLENLAERIADVLELEGKKRKELTRDILHLLRMGIYTRRLTLLTLNEFWYSCLLTIYEITNELERYGFLIQADVPPQKTYIYEIDLTGTDKCCICPVRWNSASLGDEVLLTNLVNETPVDVKKEWQNKYAAINEPMGTDSTLAVPKKYVVFPKRKVKVMFYNTDDSITAKVTFYADYLAMNFDKAKKLIGSCYEDMVKEFMRAIGMLTQ